MHSEETLLLSEMHILEEKAQRLQLSWLEQFLAFQSHLLPVWQVLPWVEVLPW